MSLTDKVIAAVTSPKTEGARIKARSEVKADAIPGSFFALDLARHEENLSNISATEGSQHLQ